MEVIYASEILVIVSQPRRPQTKFSPPQKPLISALKDICKRSGLFEGNISACIICTRLRWNGNVGGVAALSWALLCGRGTTLQAGTEMLYGRTMARIGYHM